MTPRASFVPARAQTAPIRPVQLSMNVGLQRKCSCAGTGESCSRCASKSGRSPRLMRSGTGAVPSTGVPGIVNDVLRSRGGQSLERGTREFMESRLEADFSAVRIHTDSRASDSAHAVRAHAYTVGNDIVFARGRFSPLTTDGRRLLAHELTHVVQQSGGSVRPQAFGVSPELTVDAAAEAEADRVAESVVSGGAGFQPMRSAAVGVARDEDPDREWQLACVKRLGGCASTRDGGVPKPEEIKSYNAECRLTTGYEEDVVPSDADCKRSLREASNAEVSFELEDAPISSDARRRVTQWLKKHSGEIEAAEALYGVDRRAIAGAIAWEALENIRGSWTPSSVGPGKIHIRRYKIVGENTVAKQTEDAGYLPKRSFSERKELLRTAAGSITYIGAIMKAGAAIAKEVSGDDISTNPQVLTWFYNSKDLPAWREHLKKRKAGTPFDTSANDMARWVGQNLSWIESAVGKPALPATAAPAGAGAVPLQRKPEDDSTEPKDAQEEEAEKEARKAVDAGASDAGATPSDAQLAPSDAQPVPSDAQSMPSDARPTPSDASSAPTVSPTPGTAVAKGISTAAETALSAATAGALSAVAGGPSKPQLPAVTRSTCAEAPALPSSAAPCAVTTPTAGAKPPKKESAPKVPTLPSGDFGGDATISGYATVLAKCRAGREAKDVVEDRYKKAVTEAGKTADAAAKESKRKAIEAAVEAAKESTQSEPRKTAAAVRKAREDAAKQSAQEAKEEKKKATAAVQRADETVVQGELETKYVQELASDYRENLEAALRGYGPSWSNGALNRLNNAKRKRNEQLHAKPKKKAAAAAEPEKTEDERQAELEAFLQEQRCEADASVARAFDRAKRTWMVGRREQLDFRTVRQQAAWMARGFVAPRDTEESKRQEIPPDLSGGGKFPPVAPETVGFLRELQHLYSDFHAENRRVHGSGGFQALDDPGNPKNKSTHTMGFSLDLYLDKTKKDDRGFWEPNEAIEFLMKLDQAASAAGAEWRVLYNDFNVAAEVNRRLGTRRVVFMGEVDKKGSLNWHGPDTFKLHFHLDIAPTKQLPTTAPGQAGGATAPAAPTGGANAPSP